MKHRSIILSNVINKKRNNFKISQLIDGLGDFSFQYCNIKEIIIPHNINFIGESVFENCHNLEKIDMSASGIYNLTESIFLNCFSLSEIKFPKELYQISSYCFESCNCLTKLEIPEGVEVISPHAFSNCNYLTEIKFPRSLRGGILSINRYNNGIEKLKIKLPISTAIKIIGKNIDISYY